MEDKSQDITGNLPEDIEMASPRHHLYMNPAHITIVNVPSIPCETMDNSQDNVSLSTTADIDSSALNYSEIGLPNSTIQANTIERFHHSGTSLHTSLGFSEIEIESNTQAQVNSGSSPNEEMGYSEIGLPRSDIQSETVGHGVTTLVVASGNAYTDSMEYSEIDYPTSTGTLEDDEHGLLTGDNARGKQISSNECSTLDNDKISKTRKEYPQKHRYEVNIQEDVSHSGKKPIDTRAAKPRAPPRDILTIPLRSSFDSNLINFNSPEVDKEPHSLKEMAKLFSKEPSNDIVSNPNQSKRRKTLEERRALRNLLELDNRSNINFDIEGKEAASGVKIYTENKTSSFQSNEGSKRRVLGRSFEDLPGTGKHIRNIYIKGSRRTTEDQLSSRRRSRSSESDTRVHLGFDAENRDSVSVAKSFTDNRKHMKDDDAESSLQPMQTRTGRPMPTGSNFSSPASSTDSDMSVYGDIGSLKQGKKEGKLSKTKRTPLADTRNNMNITTINASHGVKKKTRSDRKGDDKQTASQQSPMSATDASTDIQVSVKSMEDGPESQSLVPHSESKKTRRRAQGSDYDLISYDTQRVALPRRGRDDNINVYVNVNVNMIQPDPKDQRIGDGNKNTGATTMDDSKESKSDSSQGSDKNSRSDQDFEFSSSDGDSFNQELMMFKATGSRQDGLLHDNLSVNYYADQFRVLNNLGVRGLSPIPSVSYESDSTNRQLDSSSGDCGKMTPRGECPSISSESTLKGNHSDDDSVDLKRLTERHYFKSHSKSAFVDTNEIKQARKLSFNDEVVSIPDFPSPSTGDDKRKRSISKSKRERDQPRRTIISRSHSQPEQYLMQKRQSAISQMSAQQPPAAGEFMDDAFPRPRLHSWHKPLCKQSSEGARYNGFTGSYEDDNRLPLNVRAPTSPISNDDNDRMFPKGEGSSGWTRFDFSRSSWHMRSPYSSRVRRTSSLISDGSRSGKRVRQLSVDIGEEWESVHKSTRPRTVSDASSVFSYRSLRQNRNKERIAVEDQIAGDQGIFARTKQPDEPQGEKDTEDGLLHADVPVVEEMETPFSELEDRDPRPTEAPPQAVVVEMEAEGDDDFFTLPPEKRILLNNPYNDINQRFHSTLHCPCFIFFCFLCCAPAVYWMQRSDYEFDHASEKLAKKYGRRATVLYVTGAILSVLLLTGAIVATVILLEDHLTADTSL